MQADGVAGRNNSTRDDVVAVDQGASNGLADAIDVNRRSGDESDDEANGGSQQARNHQDSKPTHINAVVGVGDPITKGCPVALASAANCGGHGRNKDGKTFLQIGEWRLNPMKTYAKVFNSQYSELALNRSS